MSLLASFSIRLIGCLLVGPFSGGVQASDCKSPDWLSYQGSCYGFFSEERTWHHADHACETQGGHLATIENDQEYEAVGSFLSKLGAYEDVWTQQPLKSSKSDFLDVSPMEYREKERPGESSPSPSTPWIESTVAQKDRACGALDKASGFKHGKYMPCKETLPFLCEMDLH